MKIGLTKNHFLQALGTGVAVYVLFHVAAFSFGAVIKIIQTFASWCRYTLLPLAEELAFVVGIGYLFLMAILHSKRDD